MNKKFLRILGTLIIISFSHTSPNFGEEQFKYNSNTKVKDQDDVNPKYLEKKESKIYLNANKLKDLLIKNNYEIEKLKSQIDQTNSILKSKYSAWSPRINITSDQIPKYTTSDTRETFSENTSSNKLQVGATTSLEWDIINPKRRIEINIAKDKLEKSKYIYESRLEDLYLETLDTFYSIISSKQEIKMANESIKVSSLILKEIQNRFDSGMSNKLDLLEAKTQLNRDKIILINKEEKLQSNKHKLSDILNLKKDIEIDEDQIQNFSTIWNKNKIESYNAGIKNSYNLKLKQIEININKNNSKSVLSNKKPNLTIYNNFSISTSNGETGVSNPNYQNLTKNNTNTAGLKFKLNVFDGGNIKQNFFALDKKNKELLADLNLEKNKLKTEIYEFSNKYKFIKSKLMLAKDQLRSAKESLEISLKRLEAGLGTQREVVNLQKDVIESETNYINALKSYKVIIANLEKLTGLKSYDLCTNKLKEYKKNNLKFIKFLTQNNLIPNCKITSKLNT